MHAKRRIRKGLPPLGYHRVCSSSLICTSSSPSPSFIPPLIPSSRFSRITNYRKADIFPLSGSSPAPNSPASTPATPIHSPFTRPTGPQAQAAGAPAAPSPTTICKATCRRRRPCTTPTDDRPCTMARPAPPRRRRSSNGARSRPRVRRLLHAVTRSMVRRVDRHLRRCMRTILGPARIRTGRKASTWHETWSD